MYIRKKKYPSGNLGIIVVEKVDGKMKELATIGFAKTDDEIENRGTRLHLLRGIESLQGIGASAQTLRDQDERRQSAGARTDNRNNTDKPSAKQGDNQQNNAHETSSAHRTSLHRRILGDTLTKSKKNWSVLLKKYSQKECSCARNALWQG